MKLKRILYLFLFFLPEILSAQNKQILYDFNQTPQTLMLNPGAVVNFDNHLGMPFFSNIFFQGGVSNADINYNHINNEIEKIEDPSREDILNIINDIYRGEDFFSFSQRWEAFNMGLRLKNKNIYMSFGMYQQLEGFAKDPEEMLDLVYPDEDNEDVDEIKKILEKQKYIGNLLGVFHVGVSFKVSDRLNLGVRLKFISGSADYYYPFKTLGENAKNDGILATFIPSVTESFKQVYPGLFFADGNMGMGIDLGLTFMPTENFEINASLLDLDYIGYKNYNTIYDEFLPEEHDNLVSPFNFTRSYKLNTLMKYKIFHPVYVNPWKSIYRDSRYVSAVEKRLTTEFGLHTFTEFHQEQTVWALTAFVSHDFNRYISTKLTYTYDQFSPYNIGLGISTHYKIFNLFAAADNLLNLFNIKGSNYQSVQIGMNFVF